MKKAITVACITVLALLTSVVQAQHQEPQEKLIHDAFLTVLFPHISEEVC
jgi:hypothetical protein